MLGDILRTTLIPPYKKFYALLVCYSQTYHLYNRVDFIKLKLILGNDGNYRQTWWFTQWKEDTIVMDYK